MLEVDQVHECKRLFGQRVSVRQIASRMRISRNTVRRYLRGEAVPGVYRLKEPKPRPVMGKVLGTIRELLASERATGVPRKQRLTAARIYRLLRTTHGFTGSDSSVRKLVRGLRVELRDPLEKAFVPLDYDPGVDAQVDFFESVVEYEPGVRSKVFTLLVRPCFSGKVFVYIAPNQTQAALFEGLVRAFDFFGGVFHHLWFDNLTPAVRRVLEGREREVQKDFASFVAHYGFEAEFCRPARGNEKGGVENSVKFVRSEVFTPIPKVASRSELQDIANTFMNSEEGRTIRGRDRSIGELWNLEKPELLPLPAAPFAIGDVRTCTVSSRCWISYGTNRYSVPAHLAGQQVQGRFGAETVTIRSRKGVEAVHSRIHGRNQMSLQIEHYLPLLERKLRAIDRALPMKKWLADNSSCWKRLLCQLRRREGEVAGSKAFVEAVKMCSTYGTEVVTEAVSRTLRHPDVSMATLRFEIDQMVAATKAPIETIEYKGPAIKAVSTSDYDSMLEVCCG